jgi:tripartite ATP-independent transporter DctM subunit
MSTDAASETRAVHATRPAFVRRLVSLENGVLALALGAIVLVPIAETLLRSLFSTGISGSTTIVQHLTLLIGMFGGAIAARESRMLALSTVDTFLKGRVRDVLHCLTYGFAASIAAFLCVAGVLWIRTEIPTGTELVYGVPAWIVQSVLPFGFALVAIRLAWSAGRTWRGRVVAWAIVGAAALLAQLEPVDPERLVTPGLIALAAATLFGAPVFVTLGGAALILLWGSGDGIGSIPIDHYRLVTNPTLPTIPLFTLAGYLLAEGGASRRLMSVFQALFGRMRGGPAIVTALVCAFFTSFTGASGVTILALGGLLMPILVSAKYSERDALGLITGAGSLGMLLPPCAPLILYAIIAKVEMSQLFIAGIAPSLLLIALTIAWGMWRGPKIDRTCAPFDARAAWRAVWDAKWELALPFVAIGSMASGYATPVEAAAYTALYAGFIEVVVYRDMHPIKKLPSVLLESGLVIGGVLMILGVALGFTNYLVLADGPALALEWVKEHVESPWMFLLLLNLFLLVVGCLMDVFSAIIVVVPLVVPMAAAFGINPLHLGIVFLANLELGFLTPPVGMNLFLASYRLKKPMPEVYRAVLPMIAVMLVGVLLITYWPSLTTWLPSLFASTPPSG